MSQPEPPAPHILDRVDVEVHWANLGDLRRALAAAEALPDTAAVTLFGVQQSVTYVGGFVPGYHARMRFESTRQGDERR